MPRMQLSVRPRYQNLSIKFALHCSSKRWKSRTDITESIGGLALAFNDMPSLEVSERRGGHPPVA